MHRGFLVRQLPPQASAPFKRVSAEAAPRPQLCWGPRRGDLGHEEPAPCSRLGGEGNLAPSLGPGGRDLRGRQSWLVPRPRKRLAKLDPTAPGQQRLPWIECMVMHMHRAVATDPPRTAAAALRDAQRHNTGHSGAYNPRATAVARYGGSVATAPQRPQGHAMNQHSCS